MKDISIIRQIPIIIMKIFLIHLENVRHVLSMNLIRNLLGLLIIVSILPICMMGFRFVADIPFEYNEISDEMALSELRELLLISYDMEVSYSSLNFTYQNKNFSLSVVNNKLILQPGTQIFLNDIDDAHFETRGKTVYVIYERKNKTYERTICSSTGIYLDNFSDCDVYDDGTDSSES